MPIYIEGCKKDWGPKPFKFFNQWIHHPSYKGLIEKVWFSSLKQGWAGFVLKEKLKELKTELKAWSRETFNGVDKRIEDKNDEIEKLDILDDTFRLEDEEISRRHDLLGDLMMETSWRESQLLQKSKLKWLKERDVNSIFFHNWVNRWHKSNEIIGLWKNNIWVESVQGVKQLVYEHFKRQFEAVEDNSASFSDSLFRSCLGSTENDLKQIKRILRLFKLSSGLKVNFSKSRIYGINATKLEMGGIAATLGCEIGRGAVNYLGMNIGRNHHRKENWEWLVDKIKSRLTKWDGKNISLGGRATLIQSVLSAIPIYSFLFSSS
ncbi:hypothetical protein ACS0TY_010494 [Phlomoides rotata]